jgi:hypothetical protein
VQPGLQRFLAQLDRARLSQELQLVSCSLMIDSGSVSYIQVIGANLFLFHAVFRMLYSSGHSSGNFGRAVCVPSRAHATGSLYRFTCA